MPPKEKLTQEEITAAAFELLRRGGIEGINARALAKELNCSTMPLFRHFETMEQIRLVAVKQAEEVYKSYIERGLRDYIPAFKGSGLAYIRFAKEEPQLFRLFFMTPVGSVSGISPVDPMHDLVACAAQNSAGTSWEGAERILQEMWLFIHGIATTYVTGTADFSEETIGEMMTDVFLGLKMRLAKRGEDNNE